MKKRGKIFLLGIFLAVLVISSLISLTRVQLEQFNKAYIQEEVEEIEGLSKQVVWAVRPILREKNLSELEEYCNLFNNTDSSVTIYDNHKLLIGKEIKHNTTKEITQVEEQAIFHFVPLSIGNENYMLIISTATKHMETTLTKYKKYILVSILGGVLIVFVLAMYLFNTYWAFNRL